MLRFFRFILVFIVVINSFSSQAFPRNKLIGFLVAALAVVNGADPQVTSDFVSENSEQLEKANKIVAAMSNDEVTRLSALVQKASEYICVDEDGEFSENQQDKTHPPLWVPAFLGLLSLFILNH